MSSSVAAITTTTAAIDPADVPPGRQRQRHRSGLPLGSRGLRPRRGSRSARSWPVSWRRSGRRRASRFGVLDGLLEDLLLGLPGDLRPADDSGVGASEALRQPHLRDQIRDGFAARAISAICTIHRPDCRVRRRRDAGSKAGHRALEDSEGRRTPARCLGKRRRTGIGGLGGSDEGPIEEVHVFWLAGMSCDGCSIAVTGATAPSVEELLAGTIPGCRRSSCITRCSRSPPARSSSGPCARPPRGARRSLRRRAGGLRSRRPGPSEDGGLLLGDGSGRVRSLTSEGDQPNRVTDWLQAALSRAPRPPSRSAPARPGAGSPPPPGTSPAR